MSVVGTAQERPDSPQGDFQLGKHEITRKFLVQTSSYNDGPLTVCNAVGIPRLFSYYTNGTEFHLFCLVRDISAERIQPNSLYWEVTVKYSTPEITDPKQGTTTRDKQGEETNPLLALPEISTQFETYQQPIFGIYDLTTQKFSPCKNTAGEIFDPPPMKDASRMRLTITRNEDLLAPHPLTGILYQDAVNSDYFWGSGPGTAKIASITAERNTKQLPDGSQYAYLRVKYEVHFKNPSWDLQILDAGNFWLSPPPTPTLNPNAPPPPPRTKNAFVDQQGHPYVGLLNGVDGEKLADGAQPVYLTYRQYVRLPFATLNLPQSFPSVA